MEMLPWLSMAIASCISFLYLSMIEVSAGLSHAAPLWLTDILTSQSFGSLLFSDRSHGLGVCIMNFAENKRYTGIQVTKQKHTQSNRFKQCLKNQI